MDPLPMHGRDLGVNPDDLVEAPQVEREAKQEILENKDVSSSVTKARIITGEASKISPFMYRWLSNMSTSRVLEGRRRICLAMRSLMCFMPGTSSTYVPPALMRDLSLPNSGTVRL